MDLSGIVLKEEELRNSGDPTYAHLSDSLHVLVESIPPGAVQKLAAGVAEVRKMLIPPVSEVVINERNVILHVH